MCVPKPKEFLAFSDALTITLLSLMSVGMVIIIAAAVILYSYSKQDVKDTNARVSGLLMSSLWSCLASNVVFMGPPTKLSCLFRERLNLACLTLSASSLLNMTIRLNVHSQGEQTFQINFFVNVVAFVGKGGGTVSLSA